MTNEFHSLHGQSLLLITKPSLQASALLQNFKSALSLEGKIHNIQRSLEEITTGTLILLDMAEADKKSMAYWKDNLGRRPQTAKVILLNVQDEYPFQEIEKWPHISGVFYATDDEKRVTEGMQCILRGECFFNQRLASYLITRSGFYRFLNCDAVLLTHREKEILNKLRFGASNMEIARSLFISENTVKTHLYNLFKKLAVKNRTQAVTWANHHMRG
ncbi:transcriptional regulator CsgD [Cronobacter turicensis]|nr:transcriptional regulator CsgD [Cronobacter turicensis]